MCSGLGLFLCDGLLRLMGGKIWAESSGTSGATFHVLVPLGLVRVCTTDTSPPCARTLADPSHAYDAELRGKRVALLVSHPATREVLQRELKLRGVVVQHLTHAEQLSEMLAPFDRPDLVIAELSLVKGVRALLSKLQQTHSRVAALTSAGQWAESALGNVLPLFKPVQLAKFTHTIAHLLGLKREPQQIAPPPKAPACAPAPTASSYRILIAEDNPVNHKMLLRMLSGYRCSSAYTGADALAALAREPFDLVLMDIQMPVCVIIFVCMILCRDFVLMCMLMLVCVCVCVCLCLCLCASVRLHGSVFFCVFFYGCAYYKLLMLLFLSVPGDGRPRSDKANSRTGPLGANSGLHGQHRPE